jgi:hypothetical protein
MPDPEDVVQITRAQAERIARAVELVERLDRGGLNQGPLPLMPPSDGHRPVWVVKVTGPAATSPAANVGLYPARCRQLAYSAGAATWTTVKTNDVDEMPCWAIPIEGGYCGPGVEGIGLLYEQHKDTGLPVFVLGRSEGGLTWRVTGNNGANLYSGVLVRQTAADVWADVAPTVGVVNKIVRVPSNTPSPSAGTPNPPEIANGQYVTTWPDPDLDGYFRIANAAGAQLAGSFTIGRCISSTYTEFLVTGNARDLLLSVSPVSPPTPPPPAAAPNYYVIDDGAGGLAPAYFVATPPQYPDSGPYDTYAAALAASGGAGRSPPALNVSETTTGSDPRTAGTTITLSGSETGGAGGPYTWTFGNMTPAVGTLHGGASDSQTGTTFSIAFDLLTSGTFEVNVEVHDATAGTTRNKVLTHAVDPAAVTARTTATPGAVADVDAFHVTPCDASGGNFNLSFTAAAADRLGFWWGFKNVGGAHNVTILPAGSDTIDGGASLVLTPGQTVVLYSDNLSNFFSIRGA